jgi:S1-C subfamily serine protease
VRVFKVGADSPARRGGLVEGDMLLDADGMPLTRVDDLQRAMVFADGGLRLDVWRGRARHALSVRPELRDVR